MLKNIKILGIFQLLVFIGNCHSMEELPAPNPISEFEFKKNKLERENIELKNQVNKLYKIEQENITLKNQSKQLFVSLLLLKSKTSKVEQKNIELINNNIELINQVKQLSKTKQENIELINQISKVTQKNIELINKNIELKNQVKQLSKIKQEKPSVNIKKRTQAMITPRKPGHP